MLLRHYGKDVNVDEVKAITKTVWAKRPEGDIGMTLPSLVRDAVAHYGLKAQLGYGGIDLLKHRVAMGSPSIVLVRSGEYAWHYVVVVGYDEESIFFANPTLGEVRGLSSDEFSRAWSWSGDMEGRDCGQLGSFLLVGLEIYPNSFVWVED
jgi:ABC-type bacteriocin/lantibiotic exporter with double-glycine peptidase domain